MPAFLVQLAAPGAQLVKAVSESGERTVYLFDAERESFAAIEGGEGEWTVRQGGPVALWDAVEQALSAWQDAGQPDITAVRLRITDRCHTYEIGGNPGLRWEHPIV